MRTPVLFEFFFFMNSEIQNKKLSKFGEFKEKHKKIINDLRDFMKTFFIIGLVVIMLLEKTLLVRPD
jgi:hypothetical protein